MKYRFAALRFCDDENLSDRLYWYLCDLPVKAGDKVLAPVGVHDRLQAGTAERVIEAEEKDAPYDMRLIKAAVAPLGARKLVADGVECFELGGCRYDNRHYTRYFVALYAKRAPQNMEELISYGVTYTLDGSAEKMVEMLAQREGCALLTGQAGEEVFRGLTALARQDEGPLRALGADDETLRRLQEKIR